MTVKFPLETFFETSGKQTAVFSEKLRDAIATFSCELWQKFPAWMTQNSLPQTAFARGFYNQMCSPIQPAVPAPDIQFTGGQCEGVDYFVNVTYEVLNIDTCNIATANTLDLRVSGPVKGVIFRDNNNPDTLSDCRSGSDEACRDGNWFIQFGNEQEAGIINGFRWVEAPQNSPLSTCVINSVRRVDGQPDDCGDPGAGYPPALPTSEDLRKTVTIENLDGLDQEFEIVYNQTNNTYNFPTSFKVNGVNVSLDLGGITIYGNPQNIKPSDDVGVSAPGYDGGSDGVGGTNDKIYESDFPALPDFTSPETISKTLEYLLCNDGVIETIEAVVKLIPGNNATFEVILQVLLNILSDICENLEGAELTIGFPEYYGIKPGASRPAIVYLFKVWDGQTWGKSTYSSTVTHPTQEAIDEITTIETFTRRQGSVIKTITLNDGSRIRATGEDDVTAQSNFNFLISKVKEEFKPGDIDINTVTSRDSRINKIETRIRQIEYYPNGAGANKSPSIREIIDPPK